MNIENAGRSNIISLLLIILGTGLTIALMVLPLYTFSAAVYTKKSSNTVVGDEKYKEVRAEVEAEAQKYLDQGFAVEIKENVTERTNSKGKTTSLVAFSIEESFQKRILSFADDAIPSSRVLRFLLGAMLLSLICAAAGYAVSPRRTGRWLPGSAKVLRTVPEILLLVSLVLVPVFVLINNYTFWRRIGLYRDGLVTEGQEAFYTALDGFLFGGRMGENIADAVKNLGMETSPLIWLLLAAIFIAFIGAVRLRYGAVRNTILRVLLYAFVILVCVITLYPYYVMLVTAFRSNAETLDMHFLHLLPTQWRWSNLKDIVSRGVPRYLLNSGLIAGGATLLAMFCGIPAAYAMARMNFKGKKFFLGFVIMSQMFSPVVLLIGISQLMTTLHLSDTLWGLIFINAAFNQAFAIWLLRGTFVAIPPEMEQAAKIDGCGTIGSLVRVLLPMAAPGIVTTLIFVFINAWNEYTISTVLISTASNRPITVGITQFSSFNMIEWQYLFAASLLATIPVVILFMAIEKHLTGGLTSGGVKG